MPTTIKARVEAAEGAPRIVVHGLEQAGPSHDVRVFVGNPAADARTPRDERHGWAGTIHVYGYGMGGPSEDKPRAPFSRWIPVSAAIAEAVARSREVTLVATEPSSEIPADGLLTASAVVARVLS